MLPLLKTVSTSVSYLLPHKKLKKKSVFGVWSCENPQTTLFSNEIHVTLIALLLCTRSIEQIKTLRSWWEIKSPQSLWFEWISYTDGSTYPERWTSGLGCLSQLKFLPILDLSHLSSRCPHWVSRVLFCPSPSCVGQSSLKDCMILCTVDRAHPRSCQ